MTWQDLGLIITLAWLAFWIANYFLNGRWWVWELISIVPGWSWAFAWSLLFVFCLLTQTWWGILILLYSIPMWWGAIDLNVFPKLRANKPSVKSNLESVQSFEMLNWNTEHWEELKSKPEFLGWLSEHAAPVMQLQESWNRKLELYDAQSDLEKILPRLNGKEFQVFQVSELVTATTLPVVGEPKYEKPYLRVDVQVGDKIVSLYNIHIDVHFAPSVLKRKGLLFFLQDTKARFARRKQQFEILSKELAANPNPFVFSGDFNTTTFMRAIYPFERKYQDCFREVHKGFATTFYAAHATKRWWRLDYVFVKDLKCQSYRCLDPKKLSDHWGIKVVLELKT